METNPNIERIKAELAQIAKNGSPEELKFKAELSQLIPKPASKLTVKGSVEAEKRWRKAQTRKYKFLALVIFLSLSAPVVQTAIEFMGSIIGIGGNTSLVVYLALLAFGLIHGVISLNKNHREAYISLQVSKGMNEMVALREYQTKYSTD